MTTNEEQFKTTIENKSVQTVFTETDSGQIDLNAKYQRDVVWKTDQKSAFINSVFKNITPNHLIFNIDCENNKCVCMDGKQRITSLIEFKQNKFPFEWNGEVIFYDKIHRDYKEVKDCRVMTMQERSKFDNRPVPVVKYENLSYEDQVDVFKRIQEGKKLSPGELMMSHFTNIDTIDTFEQFCTKNKDLVNRYIKSGKDRKGYVLLLSQLLCILETKDNSIPSKAQIHKFMNKYDNSITSMKTMLKNAQKKLNVYFSNSLLNSSVFTKNVINNLTQNILLSLFICCKEEYDMVETGEDEDELEKLKDIILKTIEESGKQKLGTKKSADCVEKVHSIFRAQIKKATKASKQIAVPDPDEEEVIDEPQPVISKTVTKKTGTIKSNLMRVSK